MVLYKTPDWSIIKRPDSTQLQLQFKIRGNDKTIRKSLGTSNLSLAKEMAVIVYRRTFEFINNNSAIYTLEDGIILFQQRSDARKKKRSAKADESKGEIVSRFFGPSVDMQSISVDKIENFIGFLKTKKNLSGPTVNRYLAYLKSVFNYSLKSKKINCSNPVNDIKFEKENVRKEHFSPTQISEILTLSYEISKAARPEDKSQQSFYLYIRILSVTGARASEILNLKWNNISTSNSSIVLTHTKSGYDRRIPVPEDIIREILSHKPLGSNSDEFVISMNFRSPTNFIRHWKKIRLAMNLSNDYKMHTLRHSYITNLIESNVSPKQVQLLAGHTSFSTTDGYTHAAVNIPSSTITAIAGKREGDAEQP